MFGSHLSIAGGMHHALIEARELTMDCVQVFTKNQRQWKVKPLEDQAIADWNEHRKRTKIRSVVSHDSYLINLASPDRALRSRSISLFTEELRRCDALGIGFLVTHPGAHMGAGEDKGLERVAKALDRIHRKLPDHDVLTCLEITAGQGSSLGFEFDHLRRIIDLVDEPQRLGVCLDTAHMLAAGYDLTSRAGCRRVLAECDEVLGLDRVRVIHLNDSKVPRGRRVDRHEHIGHGHVSLDAFAVLVNLRKFRKVPKILETAKEDAPDGRPWDAVNLETLRGLATGGDKMRKIQKTGNVS
ncbi:MAG: deoxyribonuclease IV [Phycisphaeraceae bacterium]|nr:deoxyribonuclease IV [Phycisphaeraceae bacterium]